MASMWRRTMLYLGLGPDDEYEDYDDVDDRAPRRRSGRPSRPASPPPVASRPAAPPRPRPVAPAAPPGPVLSTEPTEASAVRPVPNPSVVEPMAKPRQVGGVRPIPVTPTAKPHVVVPTSFNQAQDVADKFKSTQPVILNLQGIDRDLSRRLIDFSSGLCYGLGGQMEKVANQVYLLTPRDVELSADERRRLQERGLHDG